MYHTRYYSNDGNAVSRGLVWPTATGHLSKPLVTRPSQDCVKECKEGLLLLSTVVMFGAASWAGLLGCGCQTWYANPPGQPTLFRTVMSQRNLKIMRAEYPVSGICEECLQIFVSRHERLDVAEMHVKLQFEVHDCNVPSQPLRSS